MNLSKLSVDLPYQPIDLLFQAYINWNIPSGRYGDLKQGHFKGIILSLPVFFQEFSECSEFQIDSFSVIQPVDTQNQMIVVALTF